MNESDIAIPVGHSPVSVQVQSILYNTDLHGLERSVVSLSRASHLAIAAGACARVSLALGDCSSLPCVSEEQLRGWQEEHRHFLEITYRFFGKNLGSAAGHNQLAEQASADFIMVRNPDVIVSPRIFEQMLLPFSRPGVGIVEAKQLPLEHPKEYDVATGETSWASTACVLAPTALFRALGGFDSESFFLYCDDVDFSWRARLSGYKVLFQPAATVFHDKRLSHDARWLAGAAEIYYSAEAALMLAHKWSRPDLAENTLKDFMASGNPPLLKAAKVFQDRRANGTLPAPLDSDHRIAQFVGTFYAKHRFAL